MPVFVATLRAIYHADDDVAAAMIAEKIRENGEQELNDDSEDDELYVTQVVSNLIELSAEETMQLFKKTRNALIKTRIKQCFDMAKEFDQMIYILEHRAEDGFELAGYDHTRFYDVAEAVLERGESPIT